MVFAASLPARTDRIPDPRASPASSSHNRVDDIIGCSLAWKSVSELVSRLAASDRPVLIHGPTGSGKEVVAKLLHQRSDRHESPFLAVNCGALPEALIESLLFGHERGAFTGADQQREGYFSAVVDGTLFLDEIGELPLSLQPKLLRVLENRQFAPVGALRDRPFIGRIVAATHRDLPAMVQRGDFREDLFYRLNVFEVMVPPLEQRREDIPALVKLFAGQQVRTLHFTTEALTTLMAAHWPGNVRQLRSVIDRLAVLCDDDPLTRESVLPFISRPHPNAAPECIETVAAAVLKLDLSDKLAAITKAMIDLAIRESAGNKSAAARLLGVHRKVIERQMQA